MSRTRVARRLRSNQAAAAFRRWAIVPVALAAATMASLPSASGADSPTNWTKHRFDLANTGVNPTETAISPANASTLGLDWSMAGHYRSSPAVSGGVAYLSCDRADLCALDAASGRLLWRTTVSTNYPPVMPVVSGGIVYVGWSRPASVSALDASTGALLWSSQISPDGYDPKGPPVVADGLVYQSSADDTVHALDAVTGAPRWTTQVTLPSSPAIADGVLYVGGSEGPNANAGNLYALSATTGEILWKRLAPSGERLASPMLSDGRIYVGLANGPFRRPGPEFRGLRDGEVRRRAMRPPVDLYGIARGQRRAGGERWRRLPGVL